MMPQFRVNIYRTYFLVDEIVDGDYFGAPNTHTVEDHAVGNASELARVIKSEGLTFAASGGEWAANPDGSYCSDFRLGQQCEVSAHFASDVPERIANAIRRVVG